MTTMDNSRKGVANKIKIHFGIRDYFNYYSSNYKSSHVKKESNPYLISQQLYSEIVSDYNSQIKDKIVEDRYEYKIPYDLGMIALRKFKPKIGLDKDGNLINKLPVNPRATRELWDANPDAKANKVFVRYTNKHSDGYVFTIHYYKKYKAKFKNKTLYDFQFVREFKNHVSKMAQKGLIDAYLLY